MVRYYMPNMGGLHETDDPVEWCGMVDKLDVWPILNETYWPHVSPHFATKISTQNFDY